LRKYDVLALSGYSWSPYVLSTYDVLALQGYSWMPYALSRYVLNKGIELFHVCDYGPHGDDVFQALFDLSTERSL
jgi:hypothetical protein